MKLAKTLMVVFNSIFITVSIVVIAVGAFHKVSSNTQKVSLIKEVESTVGLACIVLGCFVFVIAFAGCCGTLSESKCLLSVYTILMILVWIVQFAMAILLFVLAKQVMNKGDKQEHFNADSDAELVAGDTGKVLAVTFECCGWTDVCGHYKGQIPDKVCECDSNDNSKCQTIDVFNQKHSGDKRCNTGNGITGNTKISIRPCHDVVYKEIYHKGNIGGAIMLAFSFIQFSGIFLAIFICCKIKSGESFKAERFAPAPAGPTNINVQMTTSEPKNTANGEL